MYNIACLDIKWSTKEKTTKNKYKSASKKQVAVCNHNIIMKKKKL